MVLTILAGPPCSGKTTYLKSKENIVSSDYEIELLRNKNYTQNELNILGVKNSYNKINSFSGLDNIFYDSTNLTISRRKDIFKNVNSIDINIINFISDFNYIYLNWIKRGKNLKIEMILYFFIIFKKAESFEGFKNIENVINITQTDFKELAKFLNDNKFDKEILEENKDLKVLAVFWIKGNRNFFAEYKAKLEYLEDMNKEDKLALLYSEIKYFYKDFINNLDLTYLISYENFLNGFIENILIYKIEGLSLDKDKTIRSFYRLVEFF